MWCSKCQNELFACTCPDIDERLAKIAQSPHIQFSRCPKCQKHVDRCECVPEGGAS